MRKGMLLGSKRELERMTKKSRPIWKGKVKVAKTVGWSRLC